MKWAWIALLLTGQAWTQETELSPTSHRTVPTERPSENIALRASYTMEPGPSYDLCSDPGDAEQLTDGVYTEGYFWAQKSTVGWVRAKPVILTLDLGTVKPIRGVSYHTAGGVAHVGWPEAIYIFTAGEDGVFHEIGELVGLSTAQHGPLAPKQATDAMWALDDMSFNNAEIYDHYDKNRDRYPDKMTPDLREQVRRDLHEYRAAHYGSYRYWTDRLQTHGRYVCLVVWPVGKYSFVDEIEVYAGEPAWVNEALPGPGFTDVRAHADLLAIRKGIRRRLVQDIEALRKAAAEDGVPAQTRQDVLGELAAVEAELEQASRAYGDDFQAVLPLNSWHERVLRTQAWLWRSRGLEPLTLWQSNLWDPLPLIGTPGTEAELAVDVHLMRNEHRAAAFNVSNSSDKPMQVAFRLSGLPGGDNPNYVTVHEVAWTDTRDLVRHEEQASNFQVPVAAALPEVAAENDLYTVSVPAGMTRQVWLTFHPVNVEPGTYEGEVVVESVSGGKRFPVRMHLYPLDFPEKQTLHFGGWDYTGRISPSRLITEQNRLEFIEHLRERRVDSPWGRKVVLQRGTHDETGAMTAPPSTHYFDTWVNLWPGAAQYMVFADADHHFESWPKWTPEFNTAVKAWVTFWADHARSKGISPEQLVLLLVDEPDEPYMDEIILAWAKPIREADTGVRIWEDVTHQDMNEADQDMIDACHVLSPNYSAFLRQGDDYRQYFLDKRDQGISLEFYGGWTGRVFDPYAGRIMAWTCWRYGAEAIHMWSFGDTGGASSWNEYLTTSLAYSPIFIDEVSVTAGKHLEAAREGIQDYEYFVMLNRAIRNASARGITGPELDQARRLLESLPASVCDAAGHRDGLDDDKPLGGFHWLIDLDRTLADKARIQVLVALVELAAY